MKRNLKKFLLVIISIIIIVTFSTLILVKYKEYINKKIIENAVVKVELIEDLNIPFNTKIYVSDLIEYINGTIIEDKKVNTSKLGAQSIDFEYINEDNIKIPYSFDINIVDVTAPIVWLGSSYTVTTSFSGNLEDKIMCIDDIDDNPDCHIEGEYDTSKVGSYKLNYIAIDASNNQKIWPFTLIVKEKTNYTGAKTKTDFTDAVLRYKSDITKVGIDVSEWQGEIDFEKVKNSGVEFAILRIGFKSNKDNLYHIDGQFERNIKGFNEIGIPVGIYFYSYAKNLKEAESDADWVASQLKDYQVDLPVAFDWENWSSFNSYHLSRYSLSNLSKEFLATIESYGYKGMHYSSKSYLESIWYDMDYPTWLAHYTTNTNYEKDFIFWQFCNNGRVDGIIGDVDLDVMYLKGDKNE